MSQISKEKRLLLEMLCKYPNYELEQMGLDRVISMSVQDLEDTLLGEM